MNFFRIHAREHVLESRFRYLLLGSAGSGRLMFNFEELDVKNEACVPSLTITEDAVYELLQGHDLHIFRPEGSVDLIPGDDDLLIACDAAPGRQPHQYKVSLAELGLGWNLLRGADAGMGAY